MGKSQIEGFAIIVFSNVCAIGISTIVMIAFVIFKMSDIILPLLELIPKAIEVALLIFDPKKFINDIIFAVTFGIQSAFSGIFSSANVDVIC